MFVGWKNTKGQGDDGKVQHTGNRTLLKLNAVEMGRRKIGAIFSALQNAASASQDNLHGESGQKGRMLPLLHAVRAENVKRQGNK